jgi:mannose-6-phosphate isomerase-like protein (cupin superfamily)
MFVRSLGKQPVFSAGDGSVLRELFNPAKEIELDLVGYSLAHATVPPGTVTLRHKLSASEVYYILAGHGEMRIGDEVRAVSAGDAIYIPPGRIQYIANAGNVDLAFLCIVDPAWIPECETVLESESHHEKNEQG